MFPEKVIGTERTSLLQTLCKMPYWCIVIAQSSRDRGYVQGLLQTYITNQTAY